MEYSIILSLAAATVKQCGLSQHAVGDGLQPPISTLEIRGERGEEQGGLLHVTEELTRESEALAPVGVCERERGVAQNSNAVFVSSRLESVNVTGL